jgi:hypothetical protein
MFLIALCLFNLRLLFKSSGECFLCGGGHLLDFNLGHGGAGAAKVSGFGLRILGVVVADG